MVLRSEPNRGSVADFRRFLLIARGSAHETLAQLRLGVQRAAVGRVSRALSHGRSARSAESRPRILCWARHVIPCRYDCVVRWSPRHPTNATSDRIPARFCSTVLLDGFTRRFCWTLFTPCVLPWLASAGAAAAAEGSGWVARSARRRRAGTPGRSPGRTAPPFLLPARASHG